MHPIRCGCVSDTPRGVSDYFIHFDQRIRSPILPDTSPIHSDTSPIRLEYNLISSFFFILFTLIFFLSWIFFFFIITDKVTNPSQILQIIFIIIKQIIFIYYIIIYSCIRILYFLTFPYRCTRTVSDMILAPAPMQHRLILIFKDSKLKDNLIAF
jgi:hypothetical protein